MFKTKSVTVFTHSLFTILFTVLSTLLSGCGGTESKNTNNLGSTDPTIVEETPIKKSTSFRSTWKLTGFSPSITLPLVEGYKYNFTVDWGDGSSSEITAHDDPDKRHLYATTGEYKLVIEGTLEAWSFIPGMGGNPNLIRSVEDFGDLGYKNLSKAFFRCKNLEAFEGGVTSGVTDMSSMFEGTRDFPNKVTPDTSGWDVSKVTDMNSMFKNAVNATPDTSGWDVSKVTDMSSMFSGASKADPDTSGWIVSRVTDMSSMFSGASSADPDVSDWNVSNVTNMGSMFSGASSANPDVSIWNVSAVTNMGTMFFNTPRANPDMSKWNISAVTTMLGMFNGALVSALSTENYDAFLINLAENSSKTGVMLGAVNAQYSSDAAEEAKALLRDDYRWIISDNGKKTTTP